jgi:hypothetical protein
MWLTDDSFFFFPLFSIEFLSLTSNSKMRKIKFWTKTKLSQTKGTMIKKKKTENKGIKKNFFVQILNWSHHLVVL